MTDAERFSAYAAAAIVTGDAALAARRDLLHAGVDVTEPFARELDGIARRMADARDAYRQLAAEAATVEAHEGAI